MLLFFDLCFTIHAAMVCLRLVLENYAQRFLLLLLLSFIRFWVVVLSFLLLLLRLQFHLLFRCVVHSTHVIDISGNHIFHRMDYYY